MPKCLFDLHTHTVASGHAYSTLKENLLVAKERGLLCMGTSDHYEGMAEGAKEVFFKNYRIFPEELEGVRLLKGVEANIMDYTGTLDAPEKILKSLDYVIASLHVPCIDSGTAKENTDALIGAMKNPYVKIIGHPDDDRFPLEYPRLVKAAKEEGVVLEVNNSSFRPGVGRLGAHKNVPIYLELCKDLGVPVILDSDAHLYCHIGDLAFAEEMIKNADFPEELVANYDLKRLDWVLNKINP